MKKITVILLSMACFNLVQAKTNWVKEYYKHSMDIVHKKAPHNPTSKVIKPLYKTASEPVRNVVELNFDQKTKKYTDTLKAIYYSQYIKGGIPANSRAYEFDTLGKRNARIEASQFVDISQFLTKMADNSFSTENYLGFAPLLEEKYDLSGKLVGKTITKIITNNHITSVTIDTVNSKLDSTEKMELIIGSKDYHGYFMNYTWSASKKKWEVSEGFYQKKFYNTDGKVEKLESWSWDDTKNKMMKLSTEFYYYNTAGKMTDVARKISVQGFPIAMTDSFTNIKWIKADQNPKFGFDVMGDFFTIGGDKWSSCEKYSFDFSTMKMEKANEYAQKFNTDTLLTVLDINEYNSTTANYDSSEKNVNVYSTNNDLLFAKDFSYDISTLGWDMNGETVYYYKFNTDGNLTEYYDQNKDGAGNIQWANSKYILDYNGAFVGLSETQNNINTLSVYPNPTKDMLFVKGLNETASTLSIINLQGQTVYQQTNGVSNGISVAELPSGFYKVMVIDNQGGLFQSSFIKE